MTLWDNFWTSADSCAIMDTLNCLLPSAICVRDGSPVDKNGRVSLSSPWPWVMIAQWENESISLSVLSVARVQSPTMVDFSLTDNKRVRTESFLITRPR